MWWVRLDLFNASTRSSSIGRAKSVREPDELTIRNSQTLANGQVDPARDAEAAGFGAATGALPVAACNTGSVSLLD